MLGIFLFQKYLNRLDDYKFTNRWEHKILPKQRLYWLGAVIYYFIAIGVINELLLWGNDSLFFAIIVIMFVAVIYGGYFIRSILRFIALNNQRYFQIKTGFQQSSFSKDNVVG